MSAGEVCCGESKGIVADLCPIHATLKRGAEIARRVVALPLGG